MVYAIGVGSKLVPPPLGGGNNMISGFHNNADLPEIFSHFGGTRYLSLGFRLFPYDEGF